MVELSGDAKIWANTDTDFCSIGLQRCAAWSSTPQDPAAGRLDCLPACAASAVLRRTGTESVSVLLNSEAVAVNVAEDDARFIADFIKLVAAAISDAGGVRGWDQRVSQAGQKRRPQLLGFGHRFSSEQVAINVQNVNVTLVAGPRQGCAVAFRLPLARRRPFRIACH